MLKIIIVDDESKDLNHIVNLLHEFVKVEKEILTFSKVNADLKKEIQDTSEHKIYILDIELGGISGIRVAKLIRDVDWESEIIFITNHDKMFESAHRSVYEVFDFIEKFHDFDKRLKKAVNDIIKRNFDNKMFVYDANNISLRVYYKEILYIYRDTSERKLVIVTKNNEYTVNISIKEILTMLDSRFIQCYRSCIVNKDKVREMNYKEKYFMLEDGTKVYMLSESMCKEKI